ncbi:MAG: DUF2628 domain-containing protein, partial [bacterium]|nr:DUF2628 domain-containing protein [bacterium]
ERENDAFPFPWSEKSRIGLFATLSKFGRFEEDRFNLSWNWPSFFFGPLRYFVKGMWKEGIFYTLCLGFFAGILSGFMFRDALLWYLLGGTVFGTLGSHDYYRFCLKYRDDIPGAGKARAIGMISFWLILLSPLILAFLVWVRFSW